MKAAAKLTQAMILTGFLMAVIGQVVHFILLSFNPSMILGEDSISQILLNVSALFFFLGFFALVQRNHQNGKMKNIRERL